MAMQLVRQRLGSGDLTPSFLEELWVFVTRFVMRKREAFEAALPDYEYLTVWREGEGGRLVGFAANKRVHLPGGAVAIYSGWAMLDPAVRGRNVIQAEGLRCFLHTKTYHPFRRVYWVFGASTYKSYLILPRNLGRYFPRRDRPWAPMELAVRDGVMAAMPDPNWDPERGVIRRHGVSCYREGVVADEPLPADPDIAYYAACNPGQAEGDTLLSVVPLTLSNWLFVASNVLRRHPMVYKRRRNALL